MDCGLDQDTRNGAHALINIAVDTLSVLHQYESIDFG